MNNETENKPVDLNRRRLTKTGLATPIVLATLASKNALANPAYRCTISGQLSNNYSPVPTDGTDRSETAPCALGPTVSTLQGGSGWGNVNKDAEFRTIFKDVYWVNNATPPKLRRAGGVRAASFNEVMTLVPLANANAPHDVALGRAAIAAYVGLQTSGIAFPLTLVQIQGMFDYAFRNVDYPFPGPSVSPTKANLSRQEVFDYFSFLAGGADPTIA